MSRAYGAIEVKSADIRIQKNGSKNVPLSAECWNNQKPPVVITLMSDKLLNFPGVTPPVTTPDPEPSPNKWLNEKGLMVFNLWEDREKLTVLISHNPTNPHIDYDLLSNQPIHAMYMIGMLEHLISRLKGRL